MCAGREAEVSAVPAGRSRVLPASVCRPSVGTAAAEKANVSSRTSAFARTDEWRPRATARQQTPATVAALVSTVVPVWLASVRAGLATLGSFARSQCVAKGARMVAAVSVQTGARVCMDTLDDTAKSTTGLDLATDALQVATAEDNYKALFVPDNFAALQ